MKLSIKNYTRKLDFVLIGIIFFCTISIDKLYAQYYNREVKAEIKIDNNGEFVTFTAFAENLTPSDLNLNYQFLVFKKDSNNNVSSTRQEDLFFLKANEKKVLSSSSIGINLEGSVKVILLINDLEENPLGKDVKEISGTNELLEEVKASKEQIIINQEEAKPQDGIIISGLVLENTLTRVGRDFYRYFYSDFYNKQIISPKNIEIEETPGRGRSTRITVRMGDQIIMQFFAQPKKEFLKQMASVTLLRVTAYIQQLKSGAKFKYY